MNKRSVSFFLPRDLNHFCLGCYQCLSDESNCPFYNEKMEIMKKVEAADVLIITTPNYCMAPSAPLKSFLDLTFTYWLPHKPKGYMFSKKAFLFSTAAGTVTKHALKPITRALFYWGIPWIKSYGVHIQAMNWESISDKKKEKIKKDMKKLATHLSTHKEPKVRLKTKFMFMMMREMQKANMNSNPNEEAYWEAQGWLGKKRPWKK